MPVLDELLGNSQKIAGIRLRLGQLLDRAREGRRPPPILIDGETGTGKGLVARALHRHGPRARGPFVDVNCAAIPETLLEAEMFGVERGAFSDARETKAGLFQAAHGGTMFLDEVGLLSAALQGKLLKAIEERSVRRLGSTRSQPVDVWVISASNENLTTAMQQRRFREDLYHRLAVVTVRLPPLRERGEDIVLLADHYLARACADYKLPRKTLAADAHAYLLRQSWPGNVRQLANLMERTALQTDATSITADAFGPPDEEATASSARPEQGLKTELGEVERKRVLEALETSRWNLSRAAARLGIPRNTLRYRIEKLQLRPVHATRRTAHISAAPAAPDAPISTGSRGLRWEPTRLTLLRAVIVPPAGGDLAVHVSRVLDLLVEKVEAFGGRVEEAGPSGLDAAFGVEPGEEAACRAAHAALVLAHGTTPADQPDADGWTLRLAIHAGEFLVRPGPRGLEIALDAKRDAWTNLDALLERAEPGVIVADQAAARFLERRFALEPLEPRGAAKPAYRVVGRERFGVAGRRLAPFVGRGHNVELLQGYLAAALQGRGHAIGIAGEAGIGKSRLIAEFRRALTGQSITYLEGTCSSYGDSIPYLPVLDILRQSCSIDDGDQAHVVAHKVRRRLATLGLEESLAPFPLHLLGIREATETLTSLTSEAIKLRIIDTLRQMILHAGRRQPIVFVVEDLHWIDRASEELFASLVDNLPGVPMLFLSTYRPGYRPPWVDRSYATQMALPPLSADESLTVIRWVLPSHVTDRMAQVILAKAEGNPFFLEELSRAMEDHRDSGELAAVPDTIHDVLLARLQRLPHDPRSLLQTAAVLGREAPARVLNAMVPAGERINASLVTLTALEFLYPRSADKESVYVFKHALTHEVVYGSLTSPQRQALHGAAGRALEQLYEGRLHEICDRLAYHYAQTDQTVKAIEYLAQFADKSARAYAHEEAVRALTEALGRVEQLPETDRDRKALELTLRLPASLLPLGRLTDVVAVLLPERDRIERCQDPALAAHYYYLLGRVYILVRHDLAVESARRAMAEAQRIGDKTTMGRAHSLLALAGMLSGEAARGIDDARRGITLLEETKDLSSLSYAYWALGLCCSQTGAFAEALAAEARALAIAEAIGDQPHEASARWVMGIVHAVMGDWEQGIAECQRATEKARDVLNRAITTGFLGFAYLEQGDAGRASRALEQSIPLLHQFGVRRFEGWFTAWLAETHRLEGRLDRADALAHEAIRIATEADFGIGIGWAQQALARVAAAKGEFTEAAVKLYEALATFTRIASRYEQARTHLDLATISWAGGDREAGRRHLDQAHGLFKDLNVPRYVERVERVAAEWAGSLVPGRDA